MSLLVVMSDGVDARLVAYLLAQVDQDVVRAATVADARRLLSERSWVAVVMDTTLPDGNAFDLLNVLGERNFEGGVVVLSAAKEVALKVRVLEEGADDYVVRPYEPAEFIARVKATIRRSRRNAGANQNGILRVGAISVDVNELTVALPGNHRAHLTPNEMRILYYLMLHPYRVVDHHELAARLFGLEGVTPGSNAVGVYMRRVRRKIEPDPSQPRYILTVRGQGYRFSPNAV
jgi:DNA-binding response OmpR family regulator